jgi:mRNA degradation ribonuclease J1/J2
VLCTFEDLSDREQMDAMRRDFVANVSHELRTPLTSVLGFIETLRGPAREDAAVRDRRAIADDGLIVVVAPVGLNDGRLVADPEIVLRGLPLADRREEEVIEILIDAAVDACDEAARTGERGREEIERRLHDAIANAANSQLKRRPMVVPVVVEA